MMGVPGAAAGVYLPETEWTLRSNSTCRQCRRYAVPARRQSVGSRGADDDEPLRVTGCVNVVVQRSPVLHSSAPSPESPRPLRGSPRNAGGRGCEQRCQQPPVRRDMIAPAEDFCEKLCLCAALIQRRVEISPTPLVMCRKPSAHIAHAPEVRQATVHGAAVKITGVGRQKNDFFLDSSARRCKTPPETCCGKQLPFSSSSGATSSEIARVTALCVRFEAPAWPVARPVHDPLEQRATSDERRARAAVGVWNCWEFQPQTYVRVVEHRASWLARRAHNRGYGPMLNKDVSDAVVPNVSTFEPSSLDAARVAKQGSPAFDRRHLHQPSPVELAAQELSALIFAPGERLQEQRPTREFGISRSLLREALRVLTEQGLLEQTPLRGVRIVSLSEVGRREIYTLRHALELFAIEEALPSPAAEGVTAMEFTLAATWDAARLGT